jgi:exopolyphosphatase/guanosine-5'-triphosphate,3'-diphosphate pyrophosphatase
VSEQPARGPAARAELAVAAHRGGHVQNFQQLARLTGAPPLRLGPFVTRRLQRRKLRPGIDRLATMPTRRRAQLPGVSPHRARQNLAGSIVAYEMMRQLDLAVLRSCPWALREGTNAGPSARGRR